MKPIKNWPYIDLSIPAELWELCLDLCWTYTPLGVLEDTPKPGGCRVFFDDSSSRTNTVELLRSMDWFSSITILDQGEIVDPGWRTAWHAHFKPAEIADKFIVLPSWENLPDSSRIPLIIDPGQAFGTGQHETTHLCIRLLEYLQPTSMSLFDAGCGSGVLGIAAIKLGAKRVIGRDLEQEAIDEAKINSELNGTNEFTQWICGSVLEEHGTYDLLVGNINTIFLKAHGASLISRVEPGGYLIISGFLVIDRPAIEDVFVADGQCELIKRDEMGEWSAALFRRSQ